MDNSEMIRKMLNTINESYGPTSEEEKEVINEAVQVTIDGPEADEFVSRLLQLSGATVTAVDQSPIDAHVPDSVPASVPAPVDMVPVGAEEPVAVAFDEPEFDSHEVCDDCGHEPCDCASDVVPVDFGPDGVTMEENADYDYGHECVEDEGEELDPDAYIYKQSTPPQRLVKGTMGDNPMVKEESIKRYQKIVNEYAAFLSESEDSNEEGRMSPLTASDRQEFDKDPFAEEEPKDDGSMSPMSQVKRQDVMK